MSEKPKSEKPKKETTITIEGPTEKHIFTLPDEGFSGLGVQTTVPGIPDLPTNMRVPSPNIKDGTYYGDGIIGHKMPNGTYFATNRPTENAELLSQIGVSPEMIKQAQSFQAQPQPQRDIAKEAYEDGLNRVSRGDWTLERLNAWFIGRFGEEKLKEQWGETKAPTSDFSLFYQTNKKAGKTNAEISEEWLKRQEALKQVAPPIYNVIPTGEGYAGVNLRNPNQPATEIKTGEGKTLTKPIPPEIQGKVSDLMTIQGALQKMEKLYLPEYVGPVTGRVGKVKEELVGNLPSEQVEFYNWTRDVKDALLRARSGAQINEQEYKRLAGFLPSENIPPASYEARFKRFKQEVDMILSNKAKMLEEGGYKSPNPSQGNVTKSGNRFTIEEVR